MRKVPAITEPSLEPRTMKKSIEDLKEAVEVMSGQTGGPMYPTWDDLIRLGIVQQQDVPR